MADLTVPSRFCGPANSGNGGYVCGRVAGYLDGSVLDGSVLDGAATVTLHRPPPLATAMTVETDAGGTVRVRHGDTLVAEAATTPDNPAPRTLDTVSMAVARAAKGRAQYFQDPVFPVCFVCGPARGPGDGLRIFAGRVPGRALWAAPWTPDASLADGSNGVRPEIVWAALDCPTGIAASESADLGEDAAIVLGRMTANVAGLPAVGDECRVIAWMMAS
jgi:hypothetical protein